MNGDTPRPSTVMAANGAALMVAGMTLLADWQAGSVRPWWWYGVLALIVFGALVALAHGGLGLLGFALLVWDAWSERRAAAQADTGATGGGDEDAEPDGPADSGGDDDLDTADLPRLERKREQELAHWQVFIRRLVAAGCAYGWGRDTLTKGATRVTTQPGWNVGTDLLQAAGYLFKDGAGTRLLVSEADWAAARLWEKLTYPSGEPPEIVPPPYNSATTRQNNGQTASRAVVENQTRPIGGGSTEVGQ